MAAGGNWKEMFHACEKADLELVRYHLRMGVDPNYQHPEYMTGALLESIRKGHLEVAQLLLDNGAKPNIVKDFGTETPMSIAVKQENKAAIYLLNAYLPEKDRHQEIGRRSTILLTGGNRGIGKATAKKLLLEGQKVIITTRQSEEGEAVVKALKEETKNPNISFIQGDLSNIESCMELIEKIKVAHPDLDVLINNAGVWKMEKELNLDGLEKSFMVNYLAPYLLSKELLELLKKNKPARIVNVNSVLYKKGKVDVEKTPYGLDFGKLKSYATSKLCNLMFTIDFAKEIEGSGVTINAVHPGPINTGIGDSDKLSSKFLNLIKRLWKRPEYGAVAPTWLAIDKGLKTVNGSYFNEQVKTKYIGMVKDDFVRAKLEEKTRKILDGRLNDNKK